MQHHYGCHEHVYANEVSSCLLLGACFVQELYNDCFIHKPIIDVILMLPSIVA